jgi:hypothetical protein
MYVTRPNTGPVVDNKANAIRKYKRVQTGPKIQLGGAKKGLFSVAYQVGIADIVNTLPKTPMSSQPTIEIISLNLLFIYTFSMKQFK